MYPVHGLCQGMSPKGFMNIPEGGKQTIGDGYYESCILDGEGNPIELTI